MSRKMGLGRGLASLIPDAAEVETRTSASVPDGERIERVPVDRVDAGRYQPRTEFHDEALEDLTRSVAEKGILQPLLVRRRGDRYELIAGERRLRAAKGAGLAEVPVIVRDVDDGETLELALIENIQRDDLNAVEQARAFRQLQEEFSYTQEEISKRVGKDRSTVTNHLRLLKLPEVVLSSLLHDEVSMGHARALLGLESEDVGVMLEAWRQTVEQKLSVRETEALVKRLKQPRSAPKPKKEAGLELKFQTDRLRKTFQTQVEIVSRANGSGEIRIPYYDGEELNRILDLIPEP